MPRSQLGAGGAKLTLRGLAEMLMTVTPRAYAYAMGGEPWPAATS